MPPMHDRRRVRKILSKWSVSSRASFRKIDWHLVCDGEQIDTCTRLRLEKYGRYSPAKATANGLCLLAKNANRLARASTCSRYSPEKANGYACSRKREPCWFGVRAVQYILEPDRASLSQLTVASPLPFRSSHGFPLQLGTLAFASQTALGISFFLFDLGALHWQWCCLKRCCGTSSQVEVVLCR